MIWKPGSEGCIALALKFGGGEDGVVRCAGRATWQQIPPDVRRKEKIQGSEELLGQQDPVAGPTQEGQWWAPRRIRRLDVVPRAWGALPGSFHSLPSFVGPAAAALSARPHPSRSEEAAPCLLEGPLALGSNADGPAPPSVTSRCWLCPLCWLDVTLPCLLPLGGEGATQGSIQSLPPRVRWFCSEALGLQFLSEARLLPPPAKASMA